MKSLKEKGMVIYDKLVRASQNGQILSKLLIALLVLNIVACKSDNNADTSRPNIVVILSDDSGYSDLSLFGSEIETPHLTRLAKKGIVFPNFYNNGRCSPSRASLLTGHYPHLVGVGELSSPLNETDLPGYLGFLSLEYPTLPELLRDKGYFTCMSGKWHLGGENKQHKSEETKWPTNRGFDYFFGNLGGTLNTHFKPFRQGEYKENLEQVDNGEFDDDFFSSDIFVSKAIEALELNRSSAKKPFFLYLPFAAPHAPIEGPEKLTEKYLDKYSATKDKTQFVKNRTTYLEKKNLIPRGSGKKLKSDLNDHKLDSKLASYAAMIENMDANVGKLIKDLKRSGELDNTVIFYLSDNGGSPYVINEILNAPYTGRKGELSEGGIKTPLVVSWPRKQFGSGKFVKKAWHIMDILPTCLDIIGIENLNQYTGRSFKQYLVSGEDDNYYLDRDYLFWTEREKKAVIDKDGYKLLNNRLYNLKLDPCERMDIASSNRNYIGSLRKAYRAYALRNNVEPLETVESHRINK